MTAQPLTGAAEPAADRTVVGENLSLPLFRTLSGVLAGHPYLKVVVDRAENTWHLLDTAAHPFHVNYIATRVLGMDLAALDADLDAFNASVYTDPGRRFLLGVLSLHTDEDTDGRERTFLVLETTEADTMHGELLAFFYEFVRARVDGRLPLLLKPANHGQEEELAAISEQRVPRILSHELFGSRTRTPLNPGEAVGRLRYFRTHDEYAAYAAAGAGLGWADIVAMPCLPDDVPRVAGFLNTAPITPLSHTNVLASGWGIPNAIVRDLDELVEKDGLDGAWVRYRVREDGISLERLDHEPDLRAPAWHQQRIRLDPPLLEDVPVLALHRLRAADRDRYGTKAAHLGELHHVLDSRTADLTAFYGRPRPPREDLYGHLAARLGLDAPSSAELRAAAADFVAATVGAPEGVALPFALQQHFLASSPAIQQGIGKLKMALELDAGDVLDSLCLQLQHLIRHTPVPEPVARQIGHALPAPAGPDGRLVVRSSSNAEDLPGFSAAGVYDSVITARGAGELLDAVRQVWASLLSPRSVRLRHQVGISLDDTYMGVIVQEYVPASLGGVLVTCDPTRRQDFRNVYLNCFPGSPEQVVEGSVLPQQYLYNTVEGGGRTVSLGSRGRELSAATRARLADLCLTGRLLQSHFSASDVDRPLDIEWLMTDRGDFRLVQIRPYAL
ncbi:MULTISPECIES: PEP/pyruvate-binding domain-containing protein [Streptomyces]|uniref:PEP/pyruvate-binding domain-containing protein n=1 Tax=Streptomyces TaxID=1883 RepID=UPI00163BAD22|nr:MULTISPECIES: PEP/pyruvate-binding domain-containing protein [Streptomyces]MBC2878018.1 phosphoenolpyruvate synthase [Streptomyces sp. TYQ1024]UBI41298.1 phosphoenolpyruvate synthase [Streptomyces mobaraensis]UKW33797.1 phosphoenolpyruvate synthase [Streptomyces sp. TYQ1024]